MEMITKNPGFQHISENIFRLLDKKSLTDCRLVNSLWKSLVDRQTFWLRKLNTENPKSDVRRNWDNQNTPIHYLVHFTDNPNAPLEVRNDSNRFYNGT